MILSYCSNDDVTIDTILDPNKHQDQISNYSYVYNIDLGNNSEASCPNQIVKNGENIYIKSDALKLQDEKIQAKKRLKDFVNLKSKDGCVTSVNNIKMDADRESIQNIDLYYQVLISDGKNNGKIRDYDNTFHNISIEELNTIRIECIKHGLSLYQLKWDIETQIDNATSKNEIKQILKNIGVEDI